MANPLKHFMEVARNRTTYRAGLVQTKAYRLLKQRTAKALAPEDITPAEWAFLGVLYDAPAGLRLNKVAEELGVEAPFVTSMLRKLAKKRYVHQEADPEDSRAKRICLSATGKEFVSKTETHLKEAMRPIVKGISPADLLTYFSVSMRLIENMEKHEV